MKDAAAHGQDSPSAAAAPADNVVKAPPYAVRNLKTFGRHSVWMTQPPGAAPRTHKIWPLSLWTACKLIMGIAQPQRQVRGANRLKNAGVSTPAIVQQLTIDFRRRELALELTYADGITAIELLRSGALMGKALQSCAAAIGALVPRLADAGLFNRDLKLSNLIVEETPGGWTIWIIDPVGVRLARNRIEEITRMLHRLASEPVVKKIPIPHDAIVAVLRAALRPIPKPERREVLRRLREHRPH